jgi:hypothetical protein
MTQNMLQRSGPTRVESQGVEMLILIDMCCVGFIHYIGFLIGVRRQRLVLLGQPE